MTENFDCSQAAIGRIRSAWQGSNISYALRQKPSFRSHYEASIPKERREQSLRLAFRVLISEGWKTCVDRRGPAWSLFGFRAREGSLTALRVDFETQGRDVAASLRARLMTRAPSIALVGPDGVGKSSVLEFVRQWFLREAPFISVSLRQWRPSLLPPLGRFLGKPDNLKAITPHREPGNLHLLRLAYYYVDFLIGSWWKDRRRPSERKLILYDRCAIDMAVDPYRFRLVSRRGTRMLWRMSPKPVAVILLHDQPANIYRRKRELEMHEMESQLRTWLALGEQGIVHAVIDVDAGLEEIGRRALDLLVGGFIERHERERRSVDGHEQLSWIGAILSGGSPTAAVPDIGNGRRQAEFVIVPNKSNPRFLLPLRKRTAARSLQIYNPQKPVARLLQRLLSLALRLGVARPLLRDRLVLSSPNEILPDHLSAMLGEPVSVGVSLGTPSPNQKPVLQLIDSAGRILGYGKVGWNERSVGLVRNEEALLRGLEDTKFTTAYVPRVAQASWWNGLYILLLAASDGRPSAARARLDARHIRFLAELLLKHPTADRLPLPDDALIARFKADGFHYYGHLLGSARRYCIERVADSSVPCGALHGDFTPWNIRALGERLLVLDWESGRAKAPAGWDLFRFLITTAVEVRGEPGDRIHQKLIRPGTVTKQLEWYFETVGVDRELIDPIFVSYLADELAQSLLLYGVQPGHRDEQLRRSWATLLALSLHSDGPGKCIQE